MTRKNDKKLVFRTTFDSPYHQWPKVLIDGKDFLKHIINEISKYASELPIRKRIKTSKDASESSLESSSPKQKRLKLSNVPLVIGLNESMRAVAKDELSAVLVCRDDVQNSRVFYHIPFQCQLHNCLPIPLPKDSAAELSALFNLPTVSVIGIRKTLEMQPLMDYLKSRIETAPNSGHDLSQYRNICIKKIPIPPRGKPNKNKKV